ncbi:MAG: glycosyltransferase, partial [Syntrophorhabdales bacterium]
DELVIGVDSSSTDSTERICRLYADKLFRLEPIGTSERALAWLNEQCTGDWIFRLDHDELPSTGLIKALPRLLADREYTHYWLPRRWIIGAEQVRWISQSPWWPDWQLRLFRNLPSLVSFPGHLHSDYVVQGAAGRFGKKLPSGSHPSAPRSAG